MIRLFLTLLIALTSPMAVGAASAQVAEDEWAKLTLYQVSTRVRAIDADTLAALEARAAEGDVSAGLNLALTQGRDMTALAEPYAAYFQRALEAGNPVAILNSTYPNPGTSAGFVVNNKRENYELRTKAAQAGHLPSMWALSYILSRGDGKSQPMPGEFDLPADIPEDMQAAFQWRDQGCRLGDDHSCYLRERLRFAGKGVEKDLVLAAENMRAIVERNPGSRFYRSYLSNYEKAAKKEFGDDVFARRALAASGSQEVLSEQYYSVLIDQETYCSGEIAEHTLLFKSSRPSDGLHDRASEAVRAYADEACPAARIVLMNMAPMGWTKFFDRAETAYPLFLFSARSREQLDERITFIDYARETNKAIDEAFAHLYRDVGNELASAVSGASVRVVAQRANDAVGVVLTGPDGQEAWLARDYHDADGMGQADVVLGEDLAPGRYLLSAMIYNFNADILDIAFGQAPSPISGWTGTLGLAVDDELVWTGGGVGEGYGGCDYFRVTSCRIVGGMRYWQAFAVEKAGDGSLTVSQPTEAEIAGLTERVENWESRIRSHYTPNVMDAIVNAIGNDILRPSGAQCEPPLVPVPVWVKPIGCP